MTRLRPSRRSRTAEQHLSLAAGPTTNAGNATQVIYYAQNIAAGANTVTVTFNTTVNYPDVRVLEYSGIATSRRWT